MVAKFLSDSICSGRYTYCFSNEMSTVSGKTVSFNVHGVMYVEDDGKCIPQGEIGMAITSYHQRAYCADRKGD